MAPFGEVKDTKEETRTYKRQRQEKKPNLAKAQYILVNGGLLFITDKSVATAISKMEWLFAFLPFYSKTTIHRGG